MKKGGYSEVLQLHVKRNIRDIFNFFGHVNRFQDMNIVFFQIRANYYII